MQAKFPFSVRFLEQFNTKSWIGSQVTIMKSVLLAVGSVILVIVASTLLTLSSSSPALAQLDTYEFEIIQNDVKVGEIYVPMREKGQTTYVEHWVLFPNYIYPSRDNLQSIKIVSNPVQYKSQSEFFKLVKFTEGSRYVEVTARESRQLPRG